VLAALLVWSISPRSPKHAFSHLGDLGDLGDLLVVEALEVGVASQAQLVVSNPRPIDLSRPRLSAVPTSENAGQR
jgi:hypothetical protein